MSSRVRIDIIRLAIVLSSVPLDAYLGFASGQAKLDAVYDVTLFGLPIGQIAWTVELRDNRYVAAASGATSGYFGFFRMDMVTSLLAALYPRDNQSPRISP